MEGYSEELEMWTWGLQGGLLAEGYMVSQRAGVMQKSENYI